MVNSVQLTVPLEREPNVVIRSLDGTYPRYFVYGPLVFMPAYQELISDAGPTRHQLPAGHPQPDSAAFA